MTRVFVLTALMVFVLTGPAEAYVDPGAGSMLMQLLLGGVIAGLVFLRSARERVRRWFQRRPGNPGNKVE